MAGSMSPVVSNFAESLQLKSSLPQYYWETGSADFSFGDGDTDSPFSFVFLVKPTIEATYFIMKCDTTTGNTKREYRFFNTSVGLQVWKYDQSTGGIRGRKGPSIKDDIGTWQVYGFTCSGDPECSSVKIFREIQHDTTDISSGTYIAMEPTIAKASSYLTLANGEKSCANIREAAWIAVAGELTPTQYGDLRQLLLAHVGIIV
jgi:hypothetical protein